jgi:hypothetical protein
MLGSRKNVQEMTVEEFVAGQKTGSTVGGITGDTTVDGRIIGTPADGGIVALPADGNGIALPADGDVAGGSGGAPDIKVWLIRATAVAVGLFVLCIIALVRIGHLDGDVALMKSQMGEKRGEGLKTPAAALNERPGSETEQLRMRIARLERDLEAVKLHSTRGARAEAKAAMPAKKPGKKKSQPR